MVGAPSFPPGAPGRRRILLPGARPLRNSTLTDRSLILWWTLDGPGLNGTSVIDQSRNGVTGTLTNGPTLVQGKTGSGISTVAGSSQSIQSAATFAHGIGTGDFTWSLWINKAFAPSSYSPALSNGVFAPCLYNSLGTANWGLYDGSDRPSGNALPLGYWAHLVVVRSGTTLTYYQDGVKTPSTATSSANLANATFFVGTDNGGDFATESYDDIRVYKRALSAAEVRMLYNGPASDQLQPIDKIWARMSAAASSGRTGTLSKTIAALTSASAGTVLVSGTSTPTLSNLTASSAGTVLVTGTSTPTIAALTAASTGTVLVSGTSTPTLSALTVSSAGTVLVTGTATPTIAAITSSSAGTVLVQGTGASNFNDLTTSATGTVLNTGVLSATFDDLTTSSTGTVLDTGVLSQTIAALTSSSAGTVLVSGTLAQTIDAITLVSAGTVAATGSRTGSFAQTIDPITSSSTGTVLVTGSAATTIAAITSTGSHGTVLNTGAVNATFDEIWTYFQDPDTGIETYNATGTVLVQGTLNQTIKRIRAGGMALIGTGGDFDTIEAWLATLSGTLAEDQIGALLNQQHTISPAFVISGFTTTSTARLVIRAATAAETGGASAKHNGLAGTGARIFKAGGGTTTAVLRFSTNVKHVVVQDVEIYTDAGLGTAGITKTGENLSSGLIENCIIHTFAGTAINLPSVDAGAGNVIIRNCAFWDTGTSFGIAGDGTSGSTRVVAENCTAVRTATFSSTSASGFKSVTAKNCYAGNYGTSSAAGFFGCVITNCASSDTSGSTGLQSLAATSQFNSVGGTWDLHLKTGSALIGAGTPLVDVPTDFELGTRNATTPDIGFDEFSTSLTGTLAATIAAVTSASTGTVLNTGVVSSTIDDLTLSAPGTVLDTGVVSATLAAITSASAGTVLDTGYLVSSMGNLAFSSAGTVLVKGALSTTIANLALASAVGTDTPVTLTKTLANLTVVSAGNVYTPVTLDQTLADLTSSSTGTVRVAGAVSSTFDAITVVSAGTVRVTGTLSSTVAALTSSSTGTVLVTGSVAKTLADLTSASAVSTDTPVRLVKTIPNLTLSSAGKVRITGTGVAHFSDLTSNSGGKVLVKGSLTKTIGPFRLHTRVIHPNSGSSDRYYLQIPRFNIDHPPSSDDLTGHLLEKLRQQQIWLDALSEAALQSANTPPLNPRYGTLRYAVGDWAATLGAVGLYIFKESGWTLIS